MSSPVDGEYFVTTTIEMPREREMARERSCASGASQTQMPRIGVPFLDAIEVVHGPASLIGRFFLQIEAYARRHGFSLEFASFEELIETYERNRDDWAEHFNPMFDPRVADISSDRSLCVVARSAEGEIVATCSMKGWKPHQSPLKRIVEGPDLFSLHSTSPISPIVSTITAPIAETMSGELAHNGALWVHPKIRSARLAHIVSKTANAAALTLWNSDTIFAFVPHSVVGSELGKRYGTDKAQPSFTVTQDGKAIYQAILIWMTRDDALLDLARYLDTLNAKT